jgi:NAD(P)-dependent dehydrogenase (short-subunit alcohol dehydrogenase family)
MRRRETPGRRVLITGAARGIGAATAKRLHQRGARVGLAGLEPELLQAVAAECGGAPFAICDVTRREDVETAVESIVERLAGPHISHRAGYALVTSSLAAALHLPLMGAYCA